MIFARNSATPQLKRIRRTTLLKLRNKRLVKPIRLLGSSGPKIGARLSRLLNQLPKMRRRRRGTLKMPLQMQRRRPMATIEYRQRFACPTVQ